ncbi:unnamed protein product [Euphydryas editha]|nr:unnamed protein product [Euphydryas editha]
MFQISEIFGQAYIQAATMKTAMNGFRKCGIWPYNQDHFTDVDFMPAEITNRPAVNEDAPATSNATNLPFSDVSTERHAVIENSQSTPPGTQTTIPVTSISPQAQIVIPLAVEFETEPEHHPSSLHAAQTRFLVRAVCRDLI